MSLCIHGRRLFDSSTSALLFCLSRCCIPTVLSIALLEVVIVVFIGAPGVSMVDHASLVVIFVEKVLSVLVMRDLYISHGVRASLVAACYLASMLKLGRFIATLLLRAT